MPSRPRNISAPLTFDLPVELIAKIKASRKTRGLKTASEVVRLAIEQFDFEGCTPERVQHRQISVRVAAPQRGMLKRYSRSKGTSVGELLRLALEALPARASRTPRRHSG